MATRLDIKDYLKEFVVLVHKNEHLMVRFKLNYNKRMCIQKHTYITSSLLKSGRPTYTVLLQQWYGYNLHSTLVYATFRRIMSLKWTLAINFV